MKWHPNDSLLFSASYDNTIKCWRYDDNVDDWLCTYTMEGHDSTVWQLDFDSSGEFLCSCSDDKTWSVWRMINPQNFENKGIIPGCHIRSIYSISWAGSFVATGASDNRICIFELN